MSLHMDPCHDQGGGDKEEKKRESSIGDDEKQEIFVQEPPVTNIERSSLDAGPNASSNQNKKEVDELEKAKAEMGGVIEENQRLKMCLNKILNEYHTLQMEFQNIAKKKTTKVNNDNQETKEESELVSLSLGRFPCNPKTKVSKPLKDEEKHEEGLALGLDCKFETSKSESTTEHLQDSSPANSTEVPKDEAGETWPPSKANKTIEVAREDEELSHQNPAKKARVCVRARCEAPTMNDGCQWRKYGQKISKGNPCPRAYYRCTVATTCPVRKKVQRCSQDMSILITTYEGTHNHPLPHSATAMASTTSAAASVLLSGSSTTTTPPSNNHGLNFYLSDNNSSKSNQFYLSHPSPSNPTITLDLTSFPPSYNNCSTPLHKLSSPYNNPSSILYPSSTSLNFSSSESNAISWSNGLFQTNNSNRNSNILGNINMVNNNMYYSYIQRNHGNNNNVVPTIPSSSSHLQDSTIAAATKAIAADPSFQSALAAALTSVIGSTSSSNTQGGVGENLVNKMNWAELFSSSSSSSLTGLTNSKAGGCASSL